VVQMFDRFRPYFSVFVSALPSVFIIPLTIRLYRYPSVLAAAFQLIWSIFRPIATVHTLTLGLVLTLLNPRSIMRMRDSSLISLFALPVPISLFVTFHKMWLVTGNGNPNYLFFQCFAYGLFVAVILLDVVSATVKRDKVRRMAEKGEFSKKEANGEGEKSVDGTTTDKGAARGDKTDHEDDVDTVSENEIAAADQSEEEPVVVFL
jgi:phosphatidylinositol glycan class U